MNFIIGFAVAIIGFIAAANHLQQQLSSFWDFVAFSVVFCGTLAVLLITRPKIKLRTLAVNFTIYLFGNKKDKHFFVKKCFDTVASKSIHKPNIKKIEEKIIYDGLEMIELNFSVEKIEDILTERYFAYKKTITSIASWIKRCAKYPPAFGLGGTVLGLIHLMNGLSKGADPKETGIRMAVALVATFYGLILSNLVLNPISESITERLKADEELVEIAIKTVLMIQENYNLIEAQETLNSYIPDEKTKIDFMKKSMSEFENDFNQAA